MASSLLAELRSVAMAGMRFMAKKSADKLSNIVGEPILVVVLGIGGGHFVALPIAKRLTGLHQLEVMRAEEAKIEKKLQTMRADFQKERIGYLEEIWNLRLRLAALRKETNSRDAGGVGNPVS